MSRGYGSFTGTGPQGATGPAGAAAGVASVNGLTGTISIAAGTGLSLSASGSTITISGPIVSVNGLTGAIGFAAGTGISLSTTGNTISIINTSSAGGMAIGGAITGGTLGSALFVGVSGLAQDPLNYTYNKATAALLMGTQTDDGTGARMQIQGATIVVTPPSGIGMSFALDPGGGYITANGTGYTCGVLSVYVFKGVTTYDLIGSYTNLTDPNDGQMYDIALAWNAATLATSYICYFPTSGRFIDVGSVTSFVASNGSMTGATIGAPPISPSSFNGGQAANFYGPVEIASNMGVSGGLTVGGTLTVVSAAYFTGPITTANIQSSGFSIVCSFLSALTKITTTTLISTHYIGGGLTPGSSAGTGAGTSPTITISGGDARGSIQVLTGAAPAGTNAAIVTLNFRIGYTTAPYVVLTPANAATALLSGTTGVYPATSATNMILTAGTAALTTLTTYLWNYHVMQ